MNSKLNVLLPERVRFFRSERVVGVRAIFLATFINQAFAVDVAQRLFSLWAQVRAGGGHTVILVDEGMPEQERASSQSEETPGEDYLSYNWSVPEDIEKIMSLCRHNRIEAVQELLDSGLPTDVRCVEVCMQPML